VVDDDRDVLVVAPVRELVDADLREVVERVAALPTCDDPLDDRSDGVPRNAHHVADRGLVAPLGQVADVVLERPREPRAGFGPRYLFDLDAAARAVDAARVVAQLHHHPGEVEMPPAPATTAVVPGASLPALGAPPASPRRRHIEDEPFLVEVHVEHTGPFQTQQRAE
jgi:hypothetical protein